MAGSDKLRDGRDASANCREELHTSHPRSRCPVYSVDRSHSPSVVTDIIFTFTSHTRLAGSRKAVATCAQTGRTKERAVADHRAAYSAPSLRSIRIPWLRG